MLSRTCTRELGSFNRLMISAFGSSVFGLSAKGRSSTSQMATELCCTSQHHATHHIWPSTKAASYICPFVCLLYVREPVFCVVAIRLVEWAQIDS